MRSNGCDKMRAGELFCCYVSRFTLSEVGEKMGVILEQPRMDHIPPLKGVE